MLPAFHPGVLEDINEKQRVLSQKPSKSTKSIIDASFQLFYQSLPAPKKYRGDVSKTLINPKTTGGDHTQESSNNSSLASPPLAWLTSDEEELGQVIDVTLVDQMLQETLGLGTAELCAGGETNALPQMWECSDGNLPTATATSRGAKRMSSDVAYLSNFSASNVFPPDATFFGPVAPMMEHHGNTSPDQNKENVQHSPIGVGVPSTASKASIVSTQSSDTHCDTATSNRKSTKASYSKRKQATERKRIQSISEAFDLLKSVVPTCAGAKAARVTILQRTAQHIVAQNKIIEQLKAKLELLGSDQDRPQVPMSTGADSNRIQMLPSVSRMGSIPAMNYAAPMNDTNNRTINLPPQHTRTHAPGHTLTQSRAKTQAPAPAPAQTQIYPGSSCLRTSKGVSIPPSGLGSTMSMTNIAVASDARECMCLVCANAALSVYEQVYAQTPGPPPQAQRIVNTESQVTIQTTVSPEQFQAQPNSVADLQVDLPASTPSHTLPQTSSQIEAPSPLPHSPAEEQLCAGVGQRNAAPAAVANRGSDGPSTTATVAQSGNNTTALMTKAIPAHEALETVAPGAEGVDGLVGADRVSSTSTNSTPTFTNTTGDENNIQIIDSGPAREQAHEQPQSSGGCTSPTSDKLMAHCANTRESVGVISVAGVKRKRQASDNSAPVKGEYREEGVGECNKTARMELKGAEESVSADDSAGDVLTSDGAQPFGDVRIGAHTYVHTQGQTQTATQLPQQQTNATTQPPHTYQQPEQQAIHSRPVTPPQCTTPSGDGLSDIHTVEKPSSSYGGGNTRTLMSVCLFLLMSPTSRWVMDSMQQSSAVNPTGRVLHSLSASEHRYSGYMTNMLVLILSRAMPHVLLCIRSLAALLFARVVLLIAEPSGFISQADLKQVQETRQKVDRAFQDGCISEAEELAIEALALCGHQPLQLTGIKLLAHWLTQCGHHQLRNWRIGAWVDTIVLAPRDISPLREVAHLYFQLYLIKVFYRGQDDLQAIHLQTSALNYAEVCDSRYPADTLLTQIYVSETFAMERLFPQFHYISRFYQHRALSRVLKYGQNHMKKVEEIKLFQDERNSACRFQVFPGLLIISLLLVGASVIQFTTYAFEIDGQADNPLFQYLMIIPTILLLPLAVLTCFPP